MRKNLILYVNDFLEQIFLIFISLMKNILTWCLLGFTRIAFRARLVTEGRTAVQLVRKAVNHTTGLVKAFNEAPAKTMSTVFKIF